MFDFFTSRHEVMWKMLEQGTQQDDFIQSFTKETSLSFLVCNFYNSEYAGLNIFTDVSVMIVTKYKMN